MLDVEALQRGVNLRSRPKPLTAARNNLIAQITQRYQDGEWTARAVLEAYANFNAENNPDVPKDYPQLVEQALAGGRLFYFNLSK